MGEQKKRKRKITAYQLVSKAEKILSNKDNWTTGRYVQLPPGVLGTSDTDQSFEKCPKGSKFCAMGALQNAVNHHFVHKWDVISAIETQLATSIYEVAGARISTALITQNTKLHTTEINDRFGYDVIMAGYRALKAKLRKNPKLIQLLD